MARSAPNSDKHEGVGRIVRPQHMLDSVSPESIAHGEGNEYHKPQLLLPAAEEWLIFGPVRNDDEYLFNSH